MKIYRTVQWGQLANFHMMDTRQYRDDQLAGDGWRKNVQERLAENRTITGAEQEQWLLDGFRKSRARWDVLGQQVFFAERDRNAAPDIDDMSMDGWDGYAASAAGSPRAGWTRRCATPSCLPVTSTATGPTTSRWTSRTRTRPWWVRNWCALPSRPTGNGTGSVTDPTMAWNRSPEVLQRPARLRQDHHHQGLDEGRFPGPRLRCHPRFAGQHQGHLPDPGRRPGTAVPRPTASATGVAPAVSARRHAFHGPGSLPGRRSGKHVR